MWVADFTERKGMKMANRRFVFSTKRDGCVLLEVFAPDYERACQKLADEEYTVILDDTVPDVAEAELVPE